MNHGEEFMWPAAVTAAVITWGATAYNYTNTGFSVAMIIFALFVIYTLFKRSRPYILIENWLELLQFFMGLYS